MSDPPRREQRPNRPYGGEPGARPRGRAPGPPPGAPAGRGGVGPPQGGSGGMGPPQGGSGGMGPPGRERASTGRVPPGWDGRAPGGRGPGGPGGPNGPAGPDRRDGSGRGPGDGPPTRQMPAQPREARGRHNPRRAPRPARWGGLQGGLGVCIIVASAAAGTIATMVTRNAPGSLLGLCVLAGTVVAALAVRPRAGRLIFPVPVLSYLVGALVSGYVYNRSTGTSRTALAIGAAQWIADGFFAMALATVLAVVIITVRWYLWRRRRPVPPRRPHAAPRP